MRFYLAIIIGLMLLSTTTFAGYDNQLNASDYDSATGLYIRVVTSSGEDKANLAFNLSSKISDDDYPINLFVFNPKDNTYRHLFDENYGQITNFIVETAYESANNDNKNIRNGSFRFMSGSEKVQNNTAIAERAINESIIIETYSNKTKKTTVWKANKFAGVANVMFSYTQPSNWHLDVKNQQIRLVTPAVENKQVRLKIKSYAW